MPNRGTGGPPQHGVRYIRPIDNFGANSRNACADDCGTHRKARRPPATPPSLTSPNPTFEWRHLGCVTFHTPAMVPR